MFIVGGGCFFLIHYIGGGKKIKPKTKIKICFLHS